MLPELAVSARTDMKRAPLHEAIVDILVKKNVASELPF